jgi:hypothetical protein
MILVGISVFNSAFATNRTQVALLWQAHIAMAAICRWASESSKFADFVKQFLG